MKKICISAIAIALTGCVNVPSVEYINVEGSNGSAYPEMHFLAQEIRCHLIAAMHDNYPEMEPPNDFWRIKVTVTNTAIDYTDAKANPASWIIPWSVDKFTLKPNAGRNKTLSAEGRMEFNLSIPRDADVMICPSEEGQLSHKFRPADFGLRRWIGELPRGADNSDEAIGLTTLGYTTEVQVISDVGIGGTIEDTNITAPLAASGKRTRKQKIILAGTATKSATPKVADRLSRKDATMQPSGTTVEEADKLNKDSTDRVILESLIERSEL